MSTSISRSCKFCGRKINLRKMPHGKWVAFEGYDTVHDCKKTPKKKSDDQSWKQKKTNTDLFSFDLPEIDIGGIPNKQKNTKDIPKLATPKPTRLSSTVNKAVKPAHISPTLPKIKEISKDDKLKHTISSIQHSKAIASNNNFSLSRKVIAAIFLSMLFVGMVVFIGLITSKNISDLKSDSHLQVPINRNSNIGILTSTLKPTNTAQIIPTQTLTSTPGKIYNDNLIIGCINNYSSIGVRTCPGDDEELTGYLMNGECVDLIGRDAKNIWVLMKEGGWVNSYYLSLDTDVEELPLTLCIEE